MAYHLVRLTPGPAWDPNRRRRDQLGWAQHAAYMDTLAAHGVVVFGGPLGNDPDGDADAMLLVEAFDESAARVMLSADPWFETVLRVASIDTWEIWLSAPEFARAS